MRFRSAWARLVAAIPQFKMSISYQSAFSNGLLAITAEGRDDSIQDVIDYGCAVIELAIKHGARKIFCDERRLEYALDAFDTYQSAKEIAARADRVVRVAIVCAPEFLADGKFWETVAVNRSLEVRVDTDIERAKAWLEDDENPPG